MPCNFMSTNYQCTVHDKNLCLEDRLEELISRVKTGTEKGLFDTRYSRYLQTDIAGYSVEALDLRVYAQYAGGTDKISFNYDGCDVLDDNHLLNIVLHENAHRILFKLANKKGHRFSWYKIYKSLRDSAKPLYSTCGKYPSVKDYLMSKIGLM